MKFWIIVSIINISLYLVLGILALRVWRFGKAQRRFFFLLIISVGWLTAVMLEAVVRSSLSLYEWIVRLDYFFGAFVAYFFTLFALHFPVNNLQISLKRELLLFIPILVLLVLSISGLVLDINNYDELNYNLPIYVLYLLILTIYFLVISIYSLLKKYRNSRGLSKLQLKYFLFGYTISILSLLFVSLYSAVINRISDEQFLIYISVAIIFPITTSYSILRYRLMDISFVIKRGVTHITSLIVIVGFYTYLVLLTQNILEINQLLTTLIMVLIIAVTILPFRKWLFSTIDNLFYKEEIERQKKIDNLISNLPKVSEFNQIQEDIYTLITKDKKIIDVRILILNKERGEFETTYPENAKKVTINESSTWVNYLAHEKLIVVLEEISYLIESATENEKRILHDLKLEMKSMKTKVIVCLKDDEKRLIGMILLGGKENQDAYTVQNINFLKDLAREASIGLMNVLFYKQTIERLKRDIEAGKIA